MRPDYRGCFQPFLQPGERLIAALDHYENSALPAVPAQLRTPRTPPPPSALEQRVRGALGSVLGKVSRPLEAMGGSRVVNNPSIRTVDRVGDRVENAATGLEHFADRAAERAIWGTVMDGGWHSMAGRFLVDLTNAGGDPERQALTDRRLILLVNHSTSRRNPAPQWGFGVAVPRTHIARFTAHSKVISRGRFDVTFVDGSWIALGSLSRERMERFVAVFNQGV
ncbi:hypothetical protein SAMN05428954_2663 [Streptomyces sp. 2112.3]|uniref:hypothetical protein n=1 Tax=Streptomyces sp. 2112.3 TaxID=1881023 RepID=UPI0008975960|nr:hypothetical protein [Streptomyces sp. 2112.3]SEE45194.1 hypothetical protein SAMN05428954_2663 [Streptomyces sp. 2112.3]